VLFAVWFIFFKDNTNKNIKKKKKPSTTTTTKDPKIPIQRDS
jgi:hypothetical protein